jgi:hypothetical protein
MTSKKLGHSYSHEKKRTFENLLVRSSNVVEKEREFLRRNLEKIQTGNQIVISKLGSGASSNLVSFQGLAFNED